MPAVKSPPATVDAYIARFPGDVQPLLDKIRVVIKASAPDAIEKISYGMPAYYQNGFLVSFAVWKHHIGFYPWSSEMVAVIPEISNFKGTKGSVHFPLDQPMPYEMIGEIVKFRLAENTRRKPG